MPEEECLDWGTPSVPAPEKQYAQAEYLSSNDLDRLEDEPLLDDHSAEDAKNDKKTLIVSLCTLAISIPALIGAWCWPALVIGLISGTVSAAARVAGHAISFGITTAMMIAINIYVYIGVKRRKRWFKGKACKIYGPTMCTFFAAILILADQFRHVAQDANIWPECDRGAMVTAGTINMTDLPYGANTNQACRWSSGQFACEFPSSAFMANYTLVNNGHLPINVTWTANNGTANAIPAGGPFGCTAAAQARGWPADVWNSTLSKKIFPNATQQADLQCGCVLTSNENMGHLSFIGILFTVVFTYTGFTVLMVGTLWNANIMDKCKKIKESWNDLRGRSRRAPQTRGGLGVDSSRSGLQREKGIQYHAVGV